MKTFLRLVLVGLFVWFFAGAISAQSITYHVPSAPSSPFSAVPDPVVVPDDWSLGADYSGNFYGNSATSESSEDSGSESSSDSSANNDAHGDDNFVQSTFMDYDAAVALGNEILAKQQPAAPPPQPDPSLGLAEVVRNMNLKPAIPQGTDCLILDQDDSGKLVVCADGTSSCRSLN